MRAAQSYFWGIFLIGVGILMILKYQFKLNISLSRIVIGVLFLALGVSMLIGQPGFRTKSNIIFSDGNVQVVKPEKEYNIIFGNMLIDLSEIKEDDIDGKIEINTVFGNALVKINPEISTVIEVSSAFASANTPDGSTITFGEHSYKRGEGHPILNIKANVVFGKIDIVEE
ncbi:MAG: hypothetical protein GX375_09770 [Clostridiales bacterium]|nr:hypothetical protein [Clostridiales bacterium]